MSDDTLSSTTSRSDELAESGTAKLGLAIVLECDRLAASGGAVLLDGVSRVLIGRGAARAATRILDDRRALRLDLPDRKASSDHAEVSLSKDGKRGVYLRDLGSTNGTFVGAERVTEATLGPGKIFRVGHTFLEVLEDVAIAPIEIASHVTQWPFPTLEGEFRRDLDRLERVARSAIPLLLLGETGTGKEVLARAVHDRSKRSGPFVAVNCGALPRHLVESLLFGHKKGAFSGALRDEIGFVRQADGGTLFLDEIGDLPASAQATLLRVLQEQEVTPVGSFQPVRVDLRVLAATHRSLDAMVKAEEFRADLYSRLSGLVFRIPRLAEHRSDIGILVARALGDRASAVRIRPETAALLLEYDYPHNVRELVQALEAALVLSADGVIRPPDLPERIRGSADAEIPQRASTRPPLSSEDQAIFDELTRRLGERQGNVTQVAKDMGKARQQIQRWMRRFGMGRSD